MPKKINKKIKSGKKKVGKKGAKKKVKKVSNSTHETKSTKTKLELSINKYLNTPGKYKELMCAADKWLTKYRDELVDLLKLHSNYTQDCVTYDDFKAGTFRSGEQLLEKEAESQTIPSPLLSQDRGWILGYFHCITCLVLENHPFHFQQLLPLNTYTEGVIEIIRRHTRLCTPTIHVYLEESASESSALAKQLMLTDQGLVGGPEWSPTEVHFYYRPGGYAQSDWSPTPLCDFLRVAHDPLLWSQMILDGIAHEERVRRQMNALSLNESETTRILTKEQQQQQQTDI
ncbi:unnamed protein product [Echinostoma caproni]|uniref:OTU domain-containing protein n=1 Tax=Echinostoma caproni TaxID=27848 RepID=A0A183B0N5_9TREM|nr:unnamed protein product [Echinostoma caproni]